MNEAIFAEFPSLETERLLLWEVQTEDLDLVYRFNADPEALRFVPREAGDLLGYGGLFDIATADTKAEIGYGILQDHWAR